MNFTVTCVENKQTYTEETFDELFDLYDEGDIEDNEITLDSISVDLHNTYTDNEVTSMDSITTIEDMQDLIDTLDSIENLDREDTNKLESIIEYTGIGYSNGYDVVSYYENIDDYTYYDGYSFKDLADEFCSEGLFGDAVKEVYDNDYNYLDMDYIADQLSYDYTETDYGIISPI